MRVIPTTSLVLSLLLASSCSTETTGAASASPATQDAVTVSVAKVERRDLVDQFHATGSIVPFEQVTVYSRMTGYLKSIGVDIGDRVRKGDLLAEVEAPEMESRLLEKRAAVLKAEATVERAKAEVERRRAELEFSEVSHKRLKGVYEREPDVIPEQEVDRARADLGVTRAKLRSAETEVRVAEATVAAAKAAVATIKTLTGFARITAPLTGVITERFVDPGSLIQEASSSRTQVSPIVSIARLDRLRLIVDVPEPSVLHVRRGGLAVVEVPALPGESFPARVARMATVLDPASRTMRTEIEMANPGQRLRPGMTAKVSLELRRIDGALTAPIAALRTEGDAGFVFVVDAGVAKRVAVATGMESPEWVEIVDGLEDSDQVVVAAAGALRDGDQVRVLP